MIYKCGLSAWKASFAAAAAQRTRRGHVGRRDGQGERRGKNNVCQGDSVETGRVGRRRSRDGVGGKRDGDDSMLPTSVRTDHVVIQPPLPPPPPPPPPPVL